MASSYADPAAGLQDCSFVICDVNSNGFPTRHVSEGFQRLFGYSARECVGRNCGEVMGSESILHHGLEAAMQVSGLSSEEVGNALRVLSAHVIDKLQIMASGCEDSVGFALLVNRAKSGALIPCELHMRVLRHPQLGWSYCVGLHRDASAAGLPASELLATAARGGAALEALAAARQSSGQGEASQSQLLCGTEAERCLHDTAGQMWRALFSDAVMASPAAQKAPAKTRAPAARSLASMSTASGGTLVGQDSAGDDWSRQVSGGDVRSPALSRQVSGRPAPLEVPEVCEGAPREPAARAALREEELAGRFLDLLERLPEASKDCGKRAGRMLPDPATKQLAGELDGLRSLDFPLLLADPSSADCPVVACSAAMADLLGLPAHELAGCPLREFQPIKGPGPDPGQGQGQGPGRPARCRCARARTELRRLRGDAAQGEYYDAGEGLHGARLHATQGRLEEWLPLGELAYEQELCIGSGDPIRCMFHIKQVELDNKMFMLCCLAKLSDSDVNESWQDWSGASASQGVEVEEYDSALLRSSQNIDAAMQVLASRFWLSSPMRRQSAC